MGKVRVTRKEILRAYPVVIKLGYCRLQNILKYETPLYYICGVYGWNCDIYSLDDSICISTGYRPFGNFEIPDELIKKYEDKGNGIYLRYNFLHEIRKNLVIK